MAGATTRWHTPRAVSRPRDRHAPNPVEEAMLGLGRIQALYVAVKLGIPDLLADGPGSSTLLASTTGVHPGALHRLLRFLAAEGYVALTEDGRFTLTPQGEQLTTRSRSGMAEYVLGTATRGWEVWSHLLHSVETGQPAFERVFGRDAEFIVSVAGRDLGVAARADRGVHPYGDGGGKIEPRGDLLERLKLGDAFDIDLMHARLQREAELVLGLADAGKDNPVRRHAGLQRARDLTGRHRIRARAFARERGQHGDVGVGLDGIGHQHVARRERGFEHLIMALKRGRRIDVAGRADRLGDLRQRHVLAGHLAVFVCEMMHEEGLAAFWRRCRANAEPRRTSGQFAGMERDQEEKMPYVDGFVMAVPNARLADYKKMARKGAKIWMEYGALAYHECVADDVQPGKVTSFPQAVKLKPDETVVFSWIVYKSKTDRNKIMKKVMEDPRMNEDMKNVPFDAKRMIYGGFKTLVEA